MNNATLNVYKDVKQMVRHNRKCLHNDAVFLQIMNKLYNKSIVPIVWTVI